MESCPHTFLEEINVLHRRALLLLLCRSPISVNVIIKQVIIAPQVIKIHKAALPPSLFAAPAVLPLSVAPSSPWWSRCGLWSEGDSSNHGGIHRGTDAMPVFHGETRAYGVTAD